MSKKGNEEADHEDEEDQGTRDRRGSYSSQSDPSSYTGSSSEDDDECYRKSPRCTVQRASKGFTDFAIRNIDLAEFGRREIEYAEQGMYRVTILNLLTHFCPSQEWPELFRCEKMLSTTSL